MKTNSTIKIEKEYTTSDLCLAVILKMNGGVIKRIDPAGQKKFVFCFEQDDKLDSVIRDYFMVSMDDHPLKRFYSEMREIKNMIYNYRP